MRDAERQFFSLQQRWRHTVQSFAAVDCETGRKA